MSLLTKVLAFLNLVAAGVLGWYIAQVFLARQAWERLLAEHDRVLAGSSTEEILKQFEANHPALYRQIFSGPSAPQSDEQKRTAVLNALFDPDNPKLLYSNAVDSIRKEYGLTSDDIKSVIQLRIQPERDKIEREKDTLRLSHAALVRRRAVLDTQIRDLAAEIATVGDAQKKTGRIGLEVVTKEKLEAEIEARRVELVRLFARLEEAVAAREIALGQLRDMEAELTRVRQAYDRLSRLNLKLEAEIAKAEGVAPSHNDGK